jgi:small subunit ribosomal protein S16
MIRIRLKRVGRKGKAIYRIVAIDRRKARDSKELEIVGNYDPSEKISNVQINQERFRYWLSVGAKPSTAVEAAVRFYNRTNKDQKQLRY